MAKVTWATGIDNVKGSLAKPVTKAGHVCGTYLIGTHREAATNTPKACNRLYVRNAEAYKRTTPLSEREVAARHRFSTVKAMVATRASDLSKIVADQEAFLAQKNLANGKKTLNAWYWMVCGEEYDQQHGN